MYTWTRGFPEINLIEFELDPVKSLDTAHETFRFVAGEVGMMENLTETEIHGI